MLVSGIIHDNYRDTNYTIQYIMLYRIVFNRGYIQTPAVYTHIPFHVHATLIVCVRPWAYYIHSFSFWNFYFHGRIFISSQSYFCVLLAHSFIPGKLSSNDSIYYYINTSILYIGRTLYTIRKRNRNIVSYRRCTTLYEPHPPYNQNRQRAIHYTRDKNLKCFLNEIFALRSVCILFFFFFLFLHSTS